MSWQPVANAIDYTVTATTSLNQTSCSSAFAECNLVDLLCSETYIATVIAQGSQCSSAPSSSINITTGECHRTLCMSYFSISSTIAASVFVAVPCSPSFITTQYSCGANTAAFSWTNPVDSLSFQAQIAGDGYEDIFQTTNTSYVFQNLPCGLNFKATIQVQGPQCYSLPSVSEILQTGNSSIDMTWAQHTHTKTL